MSGMNELTLPQGYQLVASETGQTWQLTKSEWIPAERRRRPRTLMRNQWNALWFYTPASAAVYAARHAAMGLKANEPVTGGQHAAK